jgi:hypothetical protein
LRIDRSWGIFPGKFSELRKARYRDVPLESFTTAGRVVQELVVPESNSPVGAADRPGHRVRVHLWEIPQGGPPALLDRLGERQSVFPVVRGYVLRLGYSAVHELPSLSESFAAVNPTGRVWLVKGHLVGFWGVRDGRHTRDVNQIPPPRTANSS